MIWNCITEAPKACSGDTPLLRDKRLPGRLACARCERREHITYHGRSTIDHLIAFALSKLVQFISRENTKSKSKNAVLYSVCITPDSGYYRCSYQ